MQTDLDYESSAGVEPLSNTYDVRTFDTVNYSVGARLTKWMFASFAEPILWRNNNWNASSTIFGTFRHWIIEPLGPIEFLHVNGMP